MPSGLYFFATGNDLVELLRVIDKITPIEFVKSGGYDSEHDIVKLTIDELPDIGTNTSGEHQSGGYLVVRAGADIHHKKVKLSVGGVRYHVYQSENMASVSLWPGGFYNQAILIVGHIDTLSKTQESQMLYELFLRVFKKHCVKIRDYYFGKEACNISHATRLVTISVKSPPEYDFVLPKENCD